MHFVVSLLVRSLNFICSLWQTCHYWGTKQQWYGEKQQPKQLTMHILHTVLLFSVNARSGGCCYSAASTSVSVPVAADTWTMSSSLGQATMTLGFRAHSSCLVLWFLQVLKCLRQLVGSHISMVQQMSQLRGVTEHLTSKAPVPFADTQADSLYTVELLDFRILWPISCHVCFCMCRTGNNEKILCITVVCEDCSSRTEMNRFWAKCSECHLLTPLSFKVYD